MQRRFFVVVAAVVFAFGASHILADEYDPPPGYYDSATGTGATLKAQLTAIMSTGHIQRTYGDFRYSAALHDADPNQPGNILLVYNRASVNATWDGGITWNREHVWPQSLQPGSATNSSTGNLGDPHALRPANPSINSSRGNKPFGEFTTLGDFRSLGTFYFPGDADKGDVARNLFYSATRWSSLGITLVNGVPGANQMGDLQSLIRWNYTDPPDEFERRRNQVIYSQALNPLYYTNNRNAFIDHPEFVWSVFGGNDNDSTLYVGAFAPGDGASAANVDLGRVIVGGPVPAAQTVDLNKDGNDPTYYAVTTAGEATSSITGRYNAFDYGPQAAAIDVGLAASTATAGLKSGTVTIDNLDVSSGGAGQGAADGNDVISIGLQVLDHAQGSFSAAGMMKVATVPAALGPNSGVHAIEVDVYNFGFTPDQALLDLDGVSPLAAPFDFVGGLQAGVGAAPATLTFSFDTTGLNVGTYAANVDIAVSDEDLPGAAGDVLALTLEVMIVDNPGDADGDGDVDLDDYAEFADCLSGPQAPAPSPACAAVFDFDVDGDLDLADYASFQRLFTGP